MTDLCHIGLRGEVLPTISVSQDLLRELVERVGRKHNIEDLAFRLPLMGTDIDSCDEKTLEIEIFPDRPDLLSPETLFHGMMPFLHDYPPKPRLNIQPGTISMTVSSDLKTIRPVILGAVVRGVSIDDDIIKRLMDHQEKLHFALGRGRKRASIGVHDLAKIAPPFRVEAVSREYKFTPLAKTQEMTISEILSEHPKGIDYAHLLDGMDKVPIILDSNNAVLSFPPIINGDHTTVTTSTRDLFIDVTGLDIRACESSLMLVCLQLATLGGKVESVRVKTCEGRDWVLDGSPREHHVSREMVQSILGNSFTDDEIKSALDEAELEYDNHEDFEELCEFTANKLNDGGIVAWFQGRSEFGPRALGSRSLLMHPGPAENKDIMNDRVKHREHWRPFAGIILEEHLTDYFNEDFNSPYMLYSLTVKDEKKEELGAITHKDGTCRIQTVNNKINERVTSLLNKFNEVSGIPAVLNTSFNDNGEPIVESPQDAIRSFLNMDIDYLVIGNYVVKK